MINPNEIDFYNQIYAINEKFYDLIYRDEWFSQVFKNITQDVITTQQTDFMVQAFGGPKRYCGRMPSNAHPHIYIDHYMWELRESYLKKAFELLNISSEIRDKWLKIDNSFKSSIIKNSIVEVTPRFTTDELIIIKR